MRPRPAQRRAHGHGQDRDQAIVDPARITRVGHPRQSETGARRAIRSETALPERIKGAVHAIIEDENVPYPAQDRTLGR